jgi:hypothetical protein
MGGGADDSAGAWMELPDEAGDISVMPTVPSPLIGGVNVTNKGFLYGVEALFKGLDYNKYLAELTSDPLGILPATVGGSITVVAALDAFVKASVQTGVGAKALAVGILALLYASHDRTAQRIARKLLGSASDEVVEELKAAVKNGL